MDNRHQRDTLYAMSQDYRLAFETVCDLNNDEAHVQQVLSGMRSDLESRCLDVCANVKELQSVCDKLKAAESEIKTRKLAFEKRIETLKKYIELCMNECGLEKITNEFIGVTICNSPPTLVVHSSALLDKDFVEIMPSYKSPKKDLIKKQLLSGKKVDGARLEYSKHLRIKV